MRSRAVLLVLALSACVSRRVIKVENRLLVEENDTLREQVAELEAAAPPPGDYERHPTLQALDGWLDRAAYTHTWTAGQTHIGMEFSGKNCEFGVTVQYFDSADVVFLATKDYLYLDKAASTESVVLLLIQLAALNYELLMGKFQVNPETGEILLSVELSTRDGIGFDTFVHALEQLLHTADARYPELQRAAAGLGL